MESSKSPHDTMGFWRNVPEEITTRVMSFLPVPDIDTCRLVCKAWKELLCQPGFLDLCDKKGPSYLFVTSCFKYPTFNISNGTFQKTMGVFDLEHRRWCSILLDRIFLTPAFANHIRIVAMNDGLIYKLFYCSVKNEHRLAMFDPVAKMTWVLPAVHGAVFALHWSEHPAVVTVVENSNFKVFLLSRRSEQAITGLFLYESSTDAWQDLGNPIEKLGIGNLEAFDTGFAKSAVYFHGIFYAMYFSFLERRVLLVSYNVEEGLWKYRLEVEASSKGFYELIVYDNRMFMSTWSKERSGADDQEVSIFEILEDSSKLIVRIWDLDLKRMFYDEKYKSEILENDISYGFAINSNSVMLFSRCTGKLVTYNVTSRCFGELPTHPLRQGLELAKRDMTSECCGELPVDPLRLM